MRYTGTVSRGIRLPVVTRGADLIKVISDGVIAASDCERGAFTIRDGDVLGVTESLLARAQGNYVTLNDIAEDVRRRVPEGDVSVLFPIMSRNRFYQVLRAIVSGVRGSVQIIFSYPTDEVGNQLVEPMNFYMKNESLAAPTFGEEEFYRVFGEYKHPFTGVDYIQLYKSIDPERISVCFTNTPLTAMSFSKNVIVAGIHERRLHKDILKKAGANVTALDELCSEPHYDGMGFNTEYGLLGSNYTSDSSVKLFPRESKRFVKELQAELHRRTGKTVEVLVYGDGAFKDPVCGIWELADPVVSPGYTDNLAGLPKEIKFKYVADNAGDKDPEKAVREAIASKHGIGKFTHMTLGTTPRRLTDLIGSLCDLTSGSGDKGTPIVYIQGYFDSYLDD